MNLLNVAELVLSPKTEADHEPVRSDSRHPQVVCPEGFGGRGHCETPPRTETRSDHAGVEGTKWATPARGVLAPVVNGIKGVAVSNTHKAKAIHFNKRRKPEHHPARKSDSLISETAQIAPLIPMTTEKPLKTIESRMQKNELYVVYSGHSVEGAKLLSYGDGAGAPRIYSKENIDPRIWENLPLAPTIEEAQRLLSENKFGVVVPLSAALELFSYSDLRSWADEQRSVTPDEVRKYAHRLMTAEPMPKGKQRLAEIKRLSRDVAQAHKLRLAEYVGATLGDLLAFLDAARAEFLKYDEDDLLADHIGDLDSAAEYLAGWGDVTEPVFDDQLPTFGYRLANLDEDIGVVEELVCLLGEQFRVAELPRQKKSSEAPKQKAG